jgi:hypothetical protein
MTVATKTKEERVREGMAILFKLREIGIDDTNPGVKAVKEAIRQWIADGIAYNSEKIYFTPFNRVGKLVLPSRAGVQPSLSLKVIDN